MRLLHLLALYDIIAYTMVINCHTKFPHRVYSKLTAV